MPEPTQDPGEAVPRMQSALAAAAKAALDGTTFMFPNEKKDVDTNAVWVKTHFEFNNPTAVTCGHDGEDEVTGFAQFGVTGKLGRGEADLLPKVKLLLNKFKSGEKFLYEGQEVLVTSAGRAGGYQVDAFWRIPITVKFSGRYPRNTPSL